MLTMPAWWPLSLLVAINVSGPSFRVRSRLAEIGAGVADAAAELSAALSGR